MTVPPAPGVRPEAGTSNVANVAIASARIDAAFLIYALPDRSILTVSLVLIRIGIGTWKPLQGCVGTPGVRHATTFSVSGGEVTCSLTRPAGPTLPRKKN